VSDLFFDARTPASRLTDMVGWPILQIVVEFIATAPDRFGMQAGDFRNPPDPAMSQTHGLASSQPAPLLFIQPAQQQIELLMIFPMRMLRHLTIRTPTLAGRMLSCHRSTPSLEWTAAYTKR
jgi:hypothetical protein